jgi:hypothetical protein
MPTDKYETLGPLLSEIGREAVEITGGDPNGIFLYVEAGDGWVGPSVFKDDGKAVRYFDPSPRLCDLLIEAWEAEEPDKRWAAMEYEIRDGKFDTRLKYPEDLKPDDDVDDRREAVLKARYGNRPVIYPPIPPGMMEFKGKPD